MKKRGERYERNTDNAITKNEKYKQHTDTQQYIEQNIENLRHETKNKLV